VITKSQYESLHHAVCRTCSGKGNIKVKYPRSCYGRYDRTCSQCKGYGLKHNLIEDDELRIGTICSVQMGIPNHNSETTRAAIKLRDEYLNFK